MIQVTKNYILKLPKGSKYVIYNPLTDKYREEIVGRNDIAHNKYAYDGLIYYIEKLLEVNNEKQFSSIK